MRAPNLPPFMFGKKVNPRFKGPAVSTDYRDEQHFFARQLKARRACNDFLEAKREADLLAKADPDYFPDV